MILRRAITGLTELRGAPGYLPWGDSTPPPPSAGAAAVAGSTVNEQTALQVAAVFGSVNVIADSVSSLPVDLMSSPHRRNGQILKPSPLVSNPFEEISAQDWWVMFTVSLALRGNFYGHIISRDKKTLYATQVMPVHPDHVRVERLSNGVIEYRFYGKVVPTDDVFHVRYMSVAGSLVGLSPIDAMRNIIGGARAGDMYANAFYQNSAMPSGIIKLQDSYDEGEAKQLKQEWMQMHGGIGASSLPAVLTEGAEFQAISVTPDQAQFLESRQFAASTISGQIFRVPPHMIGIVDRTTSWGTGIEQQEMGYVRNTLIGYLSRGERALTALHPPGQFVKFDLTERLRGDRLQRAQANALEIANGYLLPDEARASEDRPPLPDGIGQTPMAPINAQALAVMAAMAANPSAMIPQQGDPAAQQAQDQARYAVLEAEMRLVESRMFDRIGQTGHEPVSPTINVDARTRVEPTQIHNELAPDIEVRVPPIEVHYPEVRMEPTFNVAAPDVSVEPTFNVEAPNVSVEPQIHLPDQEPRRTVKKVQRNAKGQIERVIEEDV